MAQTGYTPILIYASGTASNVPLAANLTSSASGAELALNYADGKLYFKNSSGVVTLLASSATVAPVTTLSFGTTGLTPSTATSGAITVAGTLATTNGGTGLTSFTANRVFYSSSTSAIGQSANLTFDGTTLVTANFTDSSLTSGRVTYATTGGNLTDSANLLFDGTTLTANALTTTSTVTINGGTANGVAYLNGSKVLTTGSALTFDGTNLALTTTGAIYRVPTAGGSLFDAGGNNGIYILGSSNYVATYAAGSEQMRLTSTGLGIGTSSPGTKLQVYGTATATQISIDGTGRYKYFEAYASGTRRFYSGWDETSLAANLFTDGAHPITFGTSGTERMRLDSSGNLGIGTSSPTFKLDVQNSSSRFQVRNGFDTGGTTSGTGLVSVNTANNALTDFNYRAAQHAFVVGASTATAMLLDSSGNLGLGVTPSAWNSASKAIQIGNTVSLSRGGSAEMDLLWNAYVNSSGQYIYSNTSSASRYQQYAGAHSWYTAASGTAGNAISFTQAMTLFASGNLTIGGTNDSARLRVEGTTNLTTGLQLFRSGNSCSALWAEASALRFGVDGSTGFTERMALDASGNLLVGTTSSSGLGRVEVVGGSGVRINEDASGTKVLSLRSDFAGSGPAINVTTSHPLLFLTANTERARIDSSGNLLVGRTSYGGSATGIDLGKDGSVISYSSASTSASNGFSMYSNGASAYRFYVNWAGTIFATSTTITAISDQRLKENIQDIDVGLDAIMALKPRKFDWKTGKGKDKKGDRGWIAQEFEQVFPDMIDTWADPAPEGEEPYKAINADLIPVLVKAIQELKAEVDSLKAQLKGA